MATKPCGMISSSSLILLGLGYLELTETSSRSMRQISTKTNGRLVLRSFGKSVVSFVNNHD